MTVSSKTETCLCLAVWNSIHFTRVQSLSDFINQTKGDLKHEVKEVK
jgi:hypothetical protein